METTVNGVAQTIRREAAWLNAIPISQAVSRFLADYSASDRELGFFGLHEGPLSTDEQLVELRGLISDRTVTVGNRESPGSHVVLDSIAELITSGSVEMEAFGPVMHALAERPDYVRQLADQDTFNALSQLVQIQRRKQGLRSLKRQVADPGSTAESMLHVLREHWWVFGSHLVPMRRAREIQGLPDRCLALVRFDMAVHLVLVETPHVPDLVVQHPSGINAIGAAVYQAFDLARSLVRLLERDRDKINRELGFEAARVFVTVLIGHPDHAPAVSLPVLREEIRLLNTFASGFVVLTYDELIKVAEQTLAERSD
jgi:hypothetical protein